MSNQQEHPPDPMVKIALRQAQEAKDLWAALRFRYDASGSLPEGLSDMLDKRLDLIEESLAQVLGPFQFPF